MKTACDELSDNEEDWSEPLVANNEINLTKSTSPRLSARKSPSEKTKCNVQQEHLRTIIHIDIDCFYAQVEMIKNPSLATKPLGIQQKYIIVTCNYPARKLGVTKLMTVKDAKAKCPSLIMVSGEDLTDYRKMSYKISEYLTKFTKHVERLGFDENFLDVSDLVDMRQKNKEINSSRISGHVYGNDGTDLVLDDIGNKKKCTCGCYDRLTVGSHIAQEIREGLYHDIGITSCAGISYNKLLSKLIGGFHKPNQQTALFPQNAFEFVNSLPKARNIPGIGHALSKRLAGMGIVSVADLYNFQKLKLIEELGEEMAISIQNLASGVDNSPVVKYSLPQSISDEDSFRNLTVFSEVEKNIKQLVTSVVKRVEEDGRLPQTLRVTVRKFTPTLDYSVGRESRQCPLPSSAFQHIGKDNSLVVSAVHELAMNLFKKLVDVTNSFNLSLINVCVTKFVKASGSDISNYFQPKATSSEDISNAKRTKNSTTTDGPEIPTSSKLKTSCKSSDQTKECSSNEPCSTVELPTGGIMDYFGNKRKSLSSCQPKNKRSKLDTDQGVNTQTLSKSDDRTKKLVDMSVDLDVYNQLPEDIQREILHGQGHQHKQVNTSVKSPRGKQRNSIDSFFSSKTKSPPSTSKDVTNEVKSFQRDTSSTFAEGDNNLLLNENNNSIPPNVDKDVFTNLPSDIQKELVQQWKQNSNRSMNLNSAKTKSTPNLLSYFKKN